MQSKETNKCLRVGGLWDTDNRKRESGAVYLVEGLSPTLNTCGGGYRMPLIVVKNEKDKS